MIKKLNVLICDDDKYVRKMLEKIVSENNLVNNIFTAEDGIEAVKIAGNQKIDIALLDIDMPNLDGIEASKIINKTLPEVEFVFITAHMKYAIDSFCVHPYNYILKPIDIDNLKEVLSELTEIISKRYEKKDYKLERLVIKKDQQIQIVKLNDVLFFEKNTRAVLVHTSEKIYSLNTTLVELESNILDKNFIRTHQSFIVNKKKIKSINLAGNKTYQVEFYGTEAKSSLSRYKYKEVIEKISY